MTDRAQQPYKREKRIFTNNAGEELAALLELPATRPTAYALFAHCFTCSKDIAAASRISRALAGQGFGVLRFDFTGLGNSEGDFANSNFSSNVGDLLQAAEHLRRNLNAPSLLIGHSLGGAAVLAGASSIPEVKAVVTIGAPSDPSHVSHLFAKSLAQIEAEGCAIVKLGGRTFEIKRQFLEDITSQRLQSKISKMRKALLIFHSPVDDIVDIKHARAIYEAAKHPKSFISLDNADHLLARKEDSQYVADTVAAWSSRYVLAEAGRPVSASLPQSR